MYTSFSEVTAALSKKLHDLKYSDGTIQKYEREWTRFENYLSKNNIEQYDMETVKDYFFSEVRKAAQGQEYRHLLREREHPHAGSQRRAAPYHHGLTGPAGIRVPFPEHQAGIAVPLPGRKGSGQPQSLPGIHEGRKRQAHHR